MGLISEIEDRTSTLRFKPASIDPLKLDRILEAGRLAPSAKNRQPWRFIVVDDPVLKEKVAAAAYGQEHVRQAGAIIVACSTNIAYSMPNGQASYPIDITFAVSFMMLQAEKEGYGTCVVTTYNESSIRTLLTLPYSMRTVMLLAIGEIDERSPRSSRKSVQEVVSFNHW